MRNLNDKKWRKRVLSAVLALSMVLVTMLPELGFMLVSQAASDLHEYNAVSSTGGVKRAVRGVVQNLADLPQVKYGTNWENLSMGTSDRPFTILEIVSAPQNALIGYSIAGCEPIRVEDMTGLGSSFSWGGLTGIIGDAVVTQDASAGSPARFFEDEPQGNKSFYPRTEPTWDATWDGYKKTDSLKIKGYYEVVENGKGVFTVKDGKIVKAAGVAGASGNIVWHTINKFDEEHTYEDMTVNYAEPNAALPANCLKEKGDIYFTYRMGGLGDPYVEITSNDFTFFYNTDSFVTDVIGLSAGQSASYSVVVKSITPADLNSEPRWIDYADLILIAPKEYDTNIKTFWSTNCPNSDELQADGKYGKRPANRLLLTGGTDSVTEFQDDFSFEVMKKIFYKAVAEKNYAAVAYDNAIERNKGGSSCTYTLYDFNYKEKKVIKGGGVEEDAVITTSGWDNNITKLWLMLTCMDPRLIKKMFWDHNLIQKDDATGKAIMILQRDKNAQMYWDESIFLLVDPDLVLTDANSVINSGGDAWWEAYRANPDITGAGLTYVYSHTYTFQGDSSFPRAFVTGTTGADGSRFTEFNDYVKTNVRTRQIWEARHPGENYDAVIGGTDGNYAYNIPSYAALRYILNMDDNTPMYYGGELNVLHVEPSVGLTRNYDPDWNEGTLKNRIQMLLPSYTGNNGNIKITSMTMSAFVGKTDDLSKYDLIYFGNDAGGFWDNGSGQTDFHDDDMDGWLYFHMGDKLTAGKPNSSGLPRTAEFLAGATEETRFPGNDITHLMITKLEDYMEAGRPVVVHNDLFADGKMDPTCYMKSLITVHYLRPEQSLFGEGKNRLFKFEGDRIDENIRNTRINISFETPSTYVEGVNSTYLNPDGGQPSLQFKVTVDKPGMYAYNLYVDKDRNAKFENTERLRSDVLLGSSTVNISQSLSEEFEGFVQWRLEVYRTDNPKLMKSVEGGSAIKHKEGKAKEQIHVLQITPDDVGKLTADLSSSAYSSLYNNLDAFEIEVDTIKLSELDTIFKDAGGFHFDAGAAVSNTNPDSSQLRALNDKYKAWYSAKDPEHRARRLDYYNMIVVGFADAYGGTDITNRNGIAEYLYYYAAMDMSILFTHDNTSLYNSDSANGSMGYTANSMMRDIMGMNRYGVNSLQGGKNGIVSNEWLNKYREKTGVEYDQPVFNGQNLSGQAQGFTFGTLRKAGSQGADGANTTERLPYKYMVMDAGASETATIKEAHTTSQGVTYDVTTSTGFFTAGSLEKEGETTKAKRLNMGQITQYPYNISDGSDAESLQIAPTHAQWYLLNMEDPEVTVWYTLDYRKNVDSFSKIYAASPEDAANNYYIYSKGNIFYSGVGHSDTQGAGNVMERKLFVNTMIAAYRRGAQPPEVEVTNAAKVNGSSGVDYMIRVLQEVNNYGAAATAGDTLEGDTVLVVFKPVDISLADDIMIDIHYGSGSDTVHVGAIQTYGWGSSATLSRETGEGGDGRIHHLLNEKEYSFEYPKSAMSKPDGTKIVFEVWNDKIDESGIKVLEIKPQALVLLD